MHSVLSVALFAASASAQLTTSILGFKSNYGTEKLGFYGSVVNANNTHTTLALVYDNGTDMSNYASSPQTWTVGPTLFEAADKRAYADSRTMSDSRPDDEDYRLRCEVPTSTDASASCTATWGRVAAAFRVCQLQSPGPESTVYYTRTNTYGARGTYSAGTETIVQTFTARPRTSTPDWCDDETYPSTFTGVQSTQTFRRDEFAMYQVIITAGQEKLNATAGASATLSSAQPTGSQAVSGSAVSTPTGAAAPMKTLGPAVIGLGAAMAAFVL